MPIIKCKECGKDVSTEAVACPNCGAAPAKKSSAIIKYGGGFIVSIILLGVLAAMFGGSSRKNDGLVAAEQPKTAPPPPPIELTSGKLFADYSANEVAADLKYKGKRLAVKGIVKSIDKDFMDNPVVVLAAPNQFAGIRANFGKEAVSQLAQLKKGTTVTLTCIGAGMVITDPLLDCKP